MMKNLDWNKLLSSHFASAMLVFIAAFMYLRISENQLRRHGHKAMYFQQQSSERAVETVGVADLRREPLKSLWYLHVHPPLFDGIRAMASSFFPEAEEEALVKRVDGVLYLLWNFGYALLGALLYVWIAAMTRRGVGYLASFVFVLHPKLIYYATALDATVLAAVSMTWLYYELWKLGKGRGRGIGLASSLIFGFATHPFFGWPLLVVLVGALAAMKVPWKKVGVFVGIAGLVMSAYAVKQYALFGVFSSSTLALGNSCDLTKSCVDVPAEELEEFKGYLAANPPADAASVLSREKNLEGENYNAIKHLIIHKKKGIAFVQSLEDKGVGKLAGPYARELGMRLTHESRIPRNVIVDRLPWRGAYGVLLSGWGLIALVLFSTGFWIMGHRKKGGILAGVGMAFPALYVFAASPFFDRQVPELFPFVIEPIVFAFVVSQLYALGDWIYRDIVMPHMRRQWEKAQGKQT